MELKKYYLKELEKDSINKKLEESISKKDELNIQLEQLYEIYIKEKKDVDDLENATLASYFYEFIGKKEEKLDKERKEAYEAKLKYNSVKYQIDSLEVSIKNYNDQLQYLEDYKDEYEHLIEEKVIQMNNKDVYELYKHVQDSIHKQNELNKSIQLGNESLEVTKKLFFKLKDANDYAARDFLGDNFFRTNHYNKYACLEEAQGILELLQSKLNQLDYDTKEFVIEFFIDEDDQKIDRWFDSYHVDYAIKEKIYNAWLETEKLYKSLESYVNTLNQTLEFEIENGNQLRQKLDEIVVNA